MKNKFGVTIGKVLLSFFAFVVAAVISAILSEVLNLRINSPTLTLLFLGTLGFPIWYHSKISFKLIAVILGPIAGFLFWSISMVIPVEAGSGMVFVAGGVKGGAFIIGMLVQLSIMRKDQVSSVAGTISFEEKDDRLSKLVGNSETTSEKIPKADAEPVKIVHPWRKKLLMGWGVLSILWITAIAGKAWIDYASRVNDNIWEVLLDVEIDVPRAATDEDFTLEPGKIDWDQVLEAMTEEELTGKNIPRHWFSIEQLKPDSIELAQARKNFPSLKGMTNSEFSDHLWSLVQRKAMERRARKMEAFKGRVLSEYIPLIVIALISTLSFGSLIAWGIRKYPPNQLTPYAKKVIVASAVWVMGAISWFMIEEGGDLDDVLGYEYVLVYILPPLVLIVAAILWKWASKLPSENAGSTHDESLKN
jgi:hypothetical protein